MIPQVTYGPHAYPEPDRSLPFDPDPIGISWDETPPPTVPRRTTPIRVQTPPAAEPAVLRGKTLIVEGL